MDRPDYSRGKSTWECDTARRYRERSLYYKPRRDRIFVNGERHHVNHYTSMTDSPVSPFGRNFILMNASPDGMLKVSRRSNVSHDWSPRVIRTNFSVPSTPQRCQSTMDLHKSVAYTSAEDLRYHVMRKAGSCDNILSQERYISPGPPMSECSDIESLFQDDDAESMSSLYSADRSFSYSEYESECTLNVINENEESETSGSRGNESVFHPAGSAHSHLAHGRVNPKVLKEELLRLKEAQEKRRLRKSQEVKAYIENNFPNQRNLSSASTDSCLGKSVGDEVDGSYHDNRAPRRRLNYSTESQYTTESSGIGLSRTTSSGDDFTNTSIETTYINNLPGIYDDDKDNQGGSRGADRSDASRTYQHSVTNRGRQTHSADSDVTRASIDTTYIYNQDSVNSQSESRDTQDILELSDTIDCDDINFELDDSVSMQNESYDEDNALRMSKHTMYVSDHNQQMEAEDDYQTEDYSSEIVTQDTTHDKYNFQQNMNQNKEISHITQTEYNTHKMDILSQNQNEEMSNYNITQKEYKSYKNEFSSVNQHVGISNSASFTQNIENTDTNSSVDKIESKSSSTTFNQKHESIDNNSLIATHNTGIYNYANATVVETIDFQDERTEMDESSLEGLSQNDSPTHDNVLINSQTPVADSLTLVSQQNLFTRETQRGEISNTLDTRGGNICNPLEATYSINSNRAESNHSSEFNSQSEKRVSDEKADDKSDEYKNSRHFIRSIDGKLSHDISEDRGRGDTKTTVVCDSTSASGDTSHARADVKTQPLVKHQHVDDESGLNEENKLNSFSTRVIEQDSHSSEAQCSTRVVSTTDTVVTEHYYSNQDVLNEGKADGCVKPKQTVQKQFTQIHRESSDEKKIEEGLRTDVQHWIIEDNNSQENEDIVETKKKHLSEISGIEKSHVESKNKHLSETAEKTHIEKEELRTDIQHWIIRDSNSQENDEFVDTKNQHLSEKTCVEKEELRTDVQNWLIEDNHSQENEENAEERYCAQLKRVEKEDKNVITSVKRETEQGVDHTESFITKVHTTIKLPASKPVVNRTLYPLDVTLNNEEEVSNIANDNITDITKIIDGRISTTLLSKTFDSEYVTENSFDLSETFAGDNIKDITSTNLHTVTQTSENSKNISRPATETVTNVEENTNSRDIRHASNTVVNKAETNTVYSKDVPLNIDKEKLYEISETHNARISNKTKNATDGSLNIHEETLYEITESSAVYSKNVPLNIDNNQYEITEINSEGIANRTKPGNNQRDSNELADGDPHKELTEKITQQLPTARFIERSEQVIVQSYERLIIPRSTIRRQSRQVNEEISSLSAYDAHHNTQQANNTNTTEEDYLLSVVTDETFNMDNRKDDNWSSESRGNYEEEIYDNVEYNKSERKCGLKINIIKNANPLLTRYKMQTIGENEEVQFSSLEYATVKRPPTPPEKKIMPLISQNDGMDQTKMQLQDLQNSNHRFDGSSHQKSVNYNQTQEYFQSMFNITGMEEITPLHSSPYQYQTTTSYTPSQHVARELIPPVTYHSTGRATLSTSDTLDYRNLTLGEMGNENMGRSFQFARNQPMTPEEERWNITEEMVETREHNASASEIDSYYRSNESININDLSFISDTSSVYQASCSAEVTDYEESGYETRFQESDLLNISCDSSSTYSAICTAEVNVEIPDEVDQLSSTQNILSPTSEFSDPESGYYTLTRTGKVTLARQDTSEDMTSFVADENDTTIYRDQMFGEVVELHGKVELERALSTEDMTSFLEGGSASDDTWSERNLVRRVSKGATLHHVNSQEDITRFSEASSYSDSSWSERNVTETVVRGKTLHRTSSREDPRSLATTQQLQDIVDFSEQLAAEFGSFVEETYEGDATTTFENVEDEATTGYYTVEAAAEISAEDIEIGSIKVEAVAEISTEDIEIDSVKSLEQSMKVMKTEIEYFVSTEDLTGCIEIEVDSDVSNEKRNLNSNLDVDKSLVRTSSTENLSRSIKTEEIVTLRKQSAGKMETTDGARVKLTRVKSSEDMTSFETSVDVTKQSQTSGDHYKNLEQSSVKRLEEESQDEDESWTTSVETTYIHNGAHIQYGEEERKRPTLGELIKTYAASLQTNTKEPIAEEEEAETRTSIQTTYIYNGANAQYNEEVDNRQETNLTRTAITETQSMVNSEKQFTEEEEDIRTDVQTTYIYDGNNSQYNEKVEQTENQYLVRSVNHIVLEEDIEEEEEEEDVQTTSYYDGGNSQYEQVDDRKQTMAITEAQYKVKSEEEEEETLRTDVQTTYIYDGGNMHYKEYLKKNHREDETTTVTTTTTVETETSQQHDTLRSEAEEWRTQTESQGIHRRLLQSNAKRMEITSDYETNSQSQTTEDDNLTTQTDSYDISSASSQYGEDAIHSQKQTTEEIESQSGYESMSQNQDDLTSCTDTYDIHSQTSQRDMEVVQSSANYQTKSQKQTTEANESQSGYDSMSQNQVDLTTCTDSYDIHSRTSQRDMEVVQSSANYKTKSQKQATEEGWRTDTYDYDIQTSNMEHDLYGLITSETGIDHSEQFESLIDKDRDKIQMFIIYQDFAQMRERARLKQELALLSEQCDHVDNRNLEDRTEKLLKINSFLDSFLVNLNITENLQVIKTKLETVKHVERVHFYRDNSEIYEQMQKFSDIIRDLDMHRDDDKLNVKLTYCLKFLKTKTLDAKFDSLCDFVCQESQKEDMELLQNHLCLTKQGDFGSRRLLKYLSRGFSQDMKTIWKPKLRNNLQSVCENRESNFHERRVGSNIAKGDNQCCEFHASDKECCAEIELWSNSDSVNESDSGSKKITRSGFIN